MLYRLWLLLFSSLSSLLILYLSIHVAYLMGCIIYKKNTDGIFLNILNIIIGLLIGYLNNYKLTIISVILLLLLGIKFKLVLFSVYTGFFYKKL